ncbi:site-specific integrase [Asticcacaulis sp. DW145]|uniref:tyrosine-type recombinase/integrase n=1 Tax=Asticcacaulis sp. DW145 TaxID=3095608 RepID=UPI00308F19D2|nr:site-specific integrase [Asticcacaulis sp. DW145]
MAKLIHRLTPSFVKSCDRPGWYADGGGLYLRIDRTTRKWTFLYQWQKRRKEMGLGGVNEVPLQVAREKAEAARHLLKSGIDPRADTTEIKVARAKRQAITFGMVANDVLETVRADALAKIRRMEAPPKTDAERDAEKRKVEKAINPWRLSLRVYCEPIWNIPIADADTDDVLTVLKPMWTRVPESADRTRSRMERVFANAAARKLRGYDNPARWRGHLEFLLPRLPKLVNGHHPALDYTLLPKFMAELEERRARSAPLLKFTILTGSRTTEARGAKWSEFHDDDWLWIVPAIRMKSPDGQPKEHRVPLSPQARALVKEMRVVAQGSPFVFPGHRPGKCLSELTMLLLVKRMGYENITVHGFRSTFSDWAGEETDFADELVEMSIAHKVGNAVRRAYKRKDALARRRELMTAWGEYACSLIPGAYQEQLPLAAE